MFGAVQFTSCILQEACDLCKYIFLSQITMFSLYQCEIFLPFPSKFVASLILLATLQLHFQGLHYLTVSFYCMMTRQYKIPGKFLGVASQISFLKTRIHCVECSTFALCCMDGVMRVFALVIQFSKGSLLCKCFFCTKHLAKKNLYYSLGVSSLFHFGLS